jgi:hypothetical protein
MRRLLHSITYRAPPITNAAALNDEGLKKYGRLGFVNDEVRSKAYKKALGIEDDEALNRRSKAFYQHAVSDVFNEEASAISVSISQIPSFGAHKDWAIGLDSTSMVSDGSLNSFASSHFLLTPKSCFTDPVIP